MDKQFVPPEIALKLKELGFDTECFGLYSGPTNKFVFKWMPNQQECDLYFGGLLAPLWQQVYQWFIDKYKLFGETPMFVTEDGLYAHKVVIKDTFDYALYIRYDDGKFPSVYTANIKCIEELIKIVE